jgi:hypothetical protein
MFKGNRLRKIVICFLLVSLILYTAGSYMSVSAAETVVNFTVEATDIDITVPLTFNCTINPNLDDGFTYADNLIVTNNTPAPILLSVSAFRDTNKTFRNDILPSELPEGLEWNNLNVFQTKQYFALGLKASEPSEWLETYANEYIYAKTINESDSNTDLGVMAPDSSSRFDLSASYGRAVKESFTFSYKITWLAELYDPTE